MTLWLILGAMAAAVAAVLVLGLRRGPPRPDDAAEHDIAVYRSQLRELDRDRERGVLEAGELEAARLEVQRRLLAADAARRTIGAGAPRPAGWALPLALAVAVPLGAGALYLWLGHPGLVSLPFAERQREASADDGGDTLPDVTTMMARLRDRLAQQPDDVEGWVMLGRSAATLGDYDEAAAAYGRALALDGERAEVYAALGEVQVLAAGGVVTEPARRALQEALARDPAMPRARFYLAIARDQDGDKEGALADLAALLADAPAGAGWAVGVRRKATAIAEALGRDPASVLPPPAAAEPPANGGGDTAVAEMSAEQQQAMIRGMVGQLAARLEADPDDAEGWRMLGRSYTVLGEPGKAAEAFGRAAALLPDDPSVQLDHAAALLNAAGPGEPPAAAVASLEAILDRDPENADALYYLGEVRRRQGDPAAARQLWQRLLDRLPEGSDEHAWLKAQLDALPANE